MNGREFWVLRDISDEELEASLGKLLGAGARLEARIVAHLAEVEERRWHLRVGCSSLYEYCHKRLGLSDYEAFVRIAAARVARKYPLVFEMLDRRELHLTAVCEVREFLTSENHAELLAEASGKTKLQIREVLARRFPRADLPATLKKLPALEPLSPGRYRLLLTLSTEQKGKLELARDLLSHANPSFDLAIVLERALDVLIARLEKRRFGKREVPQVAGVPPRDCVPPRTVSEAAVSEAAVSEAVEPRPAALERSIARSGRRQHIPNTVRRELLARDEPCCAFVGTEGVRCGARGFLQFHHEQAWARGGADTPDNLTLLCHAHNRLMAERDFGTTHIEECTRLPKPSDGRGRRMNQD